MWDLRGIDFSGILKKPQEAFILLVGPVGIEPTTEGL
jgi:hypothetical protein